MNYSNLAEVYSKLESTSKRIEKTKIVSELLEKTPENELKEVIYLLQGNVFPKWDERKLGVSSRLAIKAISLATGENPDKIEKSWAKIGDLGEVIEDISKRSRQQTLLKKTLTISKVYENLLKIAELEGKGTVSKKLALITELLGPSNDLESKYLIRTVIGDLRVGVAEGLIRDAIAWAFLPKIKGINDFNHKGKALKLNSLEELKEHHLKEYSLIESEDKVAREIYNYLIKKVQHAYDLVNDFGDVAISVKKLEFKKLHMAPFTPVNPMLAIKAESPEEALEALGKPALCDYKLDGFRVQIHKEGNKIELFTRRLENVSKQFQELVPIINNHVHAKSCILDCEVVGYDHETNKTLPFQHISQRIKRKYDIEKTSKKVPVVINVFDVLYLNGEPVIDKSQEERRKLVEHIVKEEKRKIRLTEKIVSSDPKEIEKFYKESLKLGNEGLMIKSLTSPYVPGRRVGGWLKLKPEKETLDLVITSAEWGTGKRAKTLSSFNIACRDKNKFVEIGKVSTGLKEINSDLTFEALTKELKPLITKQNGKKVIVKPKIVLEVGYEEIQASTNYDSGYALRFPRVKKIRYDRSANDVESLDNIKKYYKKQKTAST